MKAAPPDVQAEEAWDLIMEMARHYALVVQAAGGVALLAIPREQRLSGVRDRVLRMHRMTETDSMLKDATT